MKTYVILLENKDKSLNKEVVERHVEHLKQLESEGILKLCGPFEDYPGGIVIIEAGSLEKAETIANKDPFVSEGYRDYSIRTLEVADKNNNFLL